jgi:hypothetical protein
MTRFTYAALSAAASLALFGGALTLIDPAKAETWGYSTNDLGYTNGYSSNGGSFSGTTNDLGYSTFHGTDGSGNSFSGSCSSNSLGYTSCHSW